MESDGGGWTVRQTTDTGMELWNVERTGKTMCRVFLGAAEEDERKDRLLQNLERLQNWLWKSERRILAWYYENLIPNSYRWILIETLRFIFSVWPFLSFIQHATGNDLLHNLTSVGPVSLRVDLQSGNDTAYAHYANFSVDSEERHYTLTVSGYTGTAGEHISMSYSF